MQSAPASSYAWANSTGWKSARMSPLEGDAFFTSAIRPIVACGSDQALAQNRGRIASRRSYFPFGTIIRFFNCSNFLSFALRRFDQETSMCTPFRICDQLLQFSSAMPESISCCGRFRRLPASVSASPRDIKACAGIRQYDVPWGALLRLQTYGGRIISAFCRASPP